MADAGDEIDVTAHLPDEMLHLVFSCLPLHHKLRVESVSRRFQRCVLKLLRMQPRPLELNTQTRRLNGYVIPMGRMLDALGALANKAKFSSIKMRVGHKRKLMNTLLSRLLETDCLDKVESFECNYSPSPDVLEKVIARCLKLSSVKFDFMVKPPNSQLNAAFAMDLSPILSNKVLTHLDLQLAAYHQDGLIELFRALKPHTLGKMDLSFYFHDELPPMDLSVVVKELSSDAWAALKEMNLYWETTTVIDLIKLFESLALLPALNKCNIELSDLESQPDNQFMAFMAAFFKSKIKLTVTSLGEEGIVRPTETMPDCQLVAQIRQLQETHPTMSVDFSSNGYYLKLSMGNGVFEEFVYTVPCANAQCLECRRFYPAVLDALEESANGHGSMHLEGYQLDKCRIGSVVGHLNNSDPPWAWTALTAGVNRSRDMATFTFRPHARPRNFHNYHFSITVDCGPCFSSSCIRCVDVE